MDTRPPFGLPWLGSAHSAPCPAPEPPTSFLKQHLSVSSPEPTGVAGLSQARQEGGGFPVDGILGGAGSGCEEEAGRAEPCPASCRAFPEETKRLCNLEKPHLMGMQREASLSKQRTQSKQGTEEERAAPSARRSSKGTALLPHLDSINSRTCRAVEISARAPPVPVEGPSPHTHSTSVHPEPSLQCSHSTWALEKQGTAPWEGPRVRSTKVTPGQPPPVP